MNKKKKIVCIAIATLLICSVYVSSFSDVIFSTSDIKLSDNILTSVGDENIWELIGRTITSDLYYNNQTKQYNLTLDSGVINYNDSGVWKPATGTIESDVIESIKISGRTYEHAMLQSVQNIWFRERSSLVNDRPVAFIHNGYAITFNPWDTLKFDDGTQVSGKKNVEGFVDANTITYPEQYDTGIDLRYITDTSGLIEQLIIDDVSRLGSPDVGSDLIKKMTIRAYKLDGEDETESMGIIYGNDMINFKEYNNWTDDEITTSEPIYFLDENNETMFYFPEVYAFDSNESHVPILLNKSLHMTRFGNLRVEIHVPYAWLFNENTIYPITTDPTTELTYTDNPADVYAEYSTGGRFPDRYQEIQSRWDITSIPANSNFSSVFLKVYCYFVDSANVDRDLGISKINDQTWTETITAIQYKAQSETGYRTDANGWNVTPTTHSWIKFNCTIEVAGDYDDGNGNSTVRWEDLDVPVTTSTINGVFNTISLYLGKQPGMGQDPPTNHRIRLRSSEWSDTTYRPKLEITYTVANVPPVISDESPANNSISNSINPRLSITASDEDGDTMDIYWYSNSTGPWALFGSNLSVSDDTFYMYNANFTDYITKYFWSINATDPLGNGSWTNETYSFTTIINTTVNQIVPYNTSSYRLNITANGSALLDNVTLWYRYDSDNISWGWLTYYEYVCDDSDCQAYEGEGSDGAFTPNDEEFGSTDYDNVSVDDNNLVYDESGLSSLKYQYHLFNFTIPVDVVNITNIEVTWKGYGGRAGASTYYGHELWIKDGGSWSEKDSGSSSSKETLTAIKSSGDFSDWVTDGYMEVGAQASQAIDFYKSFLYSYYVEVNIIWDTSGWQIWNDASNPDNSSPWQWDFNFPNGIGYYQFSSVGNKSGLLNETAPNVANVTDASCFSSYQSVSYSTYHTRIVGDVWILGGRFG